MIKPLLSKSLTVRQAAVFLLSFASPVFLGLVGVRIVQEYQKFRGLPPAGARGLMFIAAGLSFLALAGMLSASAGILRRRKIAGSGKPDESRRKAPAGKQAAWTGRLAAFLAARPILASFLIALLFFVLCLAVLRPGYDSNDEAAMISLLTGYPGAAPSPFMVYTNVLLGFILVPLYSLWGSVNWYVVLLALAGFLSVWALLSVVIAGKMAAGLKAAAVGAVLLSDLRLQLDLSYTSTAAIACLAGFCLAVSALRPAAALKKRFILGAGLIFLGSLIRIQAFAILFLVLIPAALLEFRPSRWKGALAALLAVLIPVAIGYGVNLWYWRSSPLWRPFIIYNQARSALQDTPRLSNLGPAAGSVGWSQNDLELFANWFFADPQTYSLQNLRDLVDRVPGRSGLGAALGLMARSATSLQACVLVLLILAVWLVLLLKASGWRPLVRAALAFTSFLAVDFILAWTESLPDRVELPMLAAGTIFILCSLDPPAPPRDDPARPVRLDGFPARLGGTCLVLLLLAAGISALGQAVALSVQNGREQAAYRKILADIGALASSGQISKDAIILSADGSLPVEWSPPFVHELPPVAYLPMGWLTYSPLYASTLEKFALGTLPQGFYQKDNVYILENASILQQLTVYIQEHMQVEVKVATIYSMPDDGLDPGYKDVHLYRLTP